MATTVVYSDPKELPVTVSIGTQRVFNGGYQYTYRFVQEIQLYVCDQRTTTGVDGEVMAISISSDGDGNTWYMSLQKASCRGLAMARGSMADKWCSAHEINSGRLESMSGR